MDMIVRYPVIVTTTETRARRVLGWVDDRANIREVTTHDAPVAIIMNCRLDTLKYRYYDGRLYVRGSSSALERQKLGLYEHMCQTAFDEIMAQKATLPKGLGLIKKEWNKARIPAFHKDFYATNAEKTWMNIKPLSSFKHDEKDVVKWQEVAQQYLSSLLVVEGRLWTPVAEPVIMIKDTETGPRFEENDLSIFRNAHGPPDILRSPFGTSFQEDIYGYWTPQYDILSIEQAFNEYGGYFEDNMAQVLIPEAISTDLISLQVDRAVRLCAKFYFEHETASRNPEDRREYAKFKQALKRVSKGKPQECDTQAQANTLRHVSEYLEEDFTPIRAWSEEERLWLLDLVSRTIDRWEDRTVTLNPAQRPRLQL